MKKIICIAVFATLFQAAAAQESTPRVDGQDTAEGMTVTINEVNAGDYPDIRIFATVLKGGVPVSGLAATDFRVREDEVDQEPLTVEPQLPPLSVVVTLDNSGSMSKRMAATQTAAKAFVGSLGAEDAVQLVSFAREIRTLTPMTTTKDEVSQAIDGIVARGDTALYDALYQSVDLVAERPGRKAIVLLSDGVDDDGTGKSLSTHTIGEAVRRAGEVGVPVFVIGLGTEMDESVLSDIARATGAQYLNAPDADQLGAVYAQIGDQLSGQYSIRYTSNLPADGVARRVDLAAFDQQDSREYTPKGTPAPAPAPAIASGDCPAAVVNIDRPALEQAAKRYSESLINSTARRAVVDEAVAKLHETLTTAQMDFQCARDTLAAVKMLYQDALITSTDRKMLDAAPLASIAATCAAQTAIPGNLECIAFVNQTYQEALITSTDRNAMREAAFDRVVTELLQQGDTDGGLMAIRDLYMSGAISSTMRDSASEALLAAQ